MFLWRRTIIARGLQIVGSVKAEGSVKVKGHIEGDLHCASVFVARNAHVVGPIEATRAVIDGKVDGPIHSAEVVLRSRANVVGDIKCQSLMIDKGALVDGRLVFARQDNLKVKPDEKLNNRNGLATLRDVSAGKVSREKEKRQLAKAEASTRIIELVAEARHLSKNPNLSTEEALTFLGKRGSIEARALLNAARKGDTSIQNAVTELDVGHTLT